MFIEEIQNIIDEAQKRYKEGERIESREQIPLSDDIPLEINKWLRIDDVVCVFIDMKNSTQLSAQKQDKFTASIYQYFTDTAVKILNHFGASYIDVKGDGAFGLFKKNKIYHAFCAAMTFKTFSAYILGTTIKLEKISFHIGMDMKTVLVKRLGLRKSEGKTLKQNEVWAGKPVNMASKLAFLGNENELIASERVFDIFFKDGSELILKSCGCPSGKKKNFWNRIDLIDPKFDFSKAYKIDTPGWCKNHGVEYCENILKLDKDDR
jgi:class 3 adenylate cyclase